MILSNNNIMVHFNPNAMRVDNMIIVSSIDNQTKLPRAHSQTINGIKLAWNNFQKKFNKKTSFYEALSILEENGIKMHIYNGAFERR